MLLFVDIIRKNCEEKIDCKMIKVEITVDDCEDVVKNEKIDVPTVKTEMTQDSLEPNWTKPLINKYSKGFVASEELWHKRFEFVATNDVFKEVPLVKMEMMEEIDGDIPVDVNTKSCNDSLEHSDTNTNTPLACSPHSESSLTKQSKIVDDDHKTVGLEAPCTSDSLKNKNSKLKTKRVLKDNSVLGGKSDTLQQRLSGRKRRSCNEFNVNGIEVKNKRVKSKSRRNAVIDSGLKNPNTDMYSCPQCPYASKCKRYLTVHMKQHDSDKPFTCNVCNYKCDFKKRLVHHMRTHTGEKPFACNLCDYRCSFKQCLGVHMRIHTGEKPYSCNLCEFKCAQSSSLINHMGMHTEEKPFSCNICDYKCMFKRKLILHMRTHTGEKPYSCSICQFKCAQRSSLVNHMGMHTGEKPFSCNLCDYRGRFKQTLIVHMRTHTGEKPYSCSVCQFKCAQNSNLVNHMRIHTGEKPFACNICQFKCCRKKILVSHMKSHIEDKPVED